MYSQKKKARFGFFEVFSVLIPLCFLTSPGRGQSLPTVTINEIRIDQPGADNDEYFELAGAPGTALDGLTYLVLGDGTGGSGVIEAVIDLSGQVIPPSGFFVVAESTFTLGTANLTTSLNFENSDNVTHMLVMGFSASNGDDLDTNDDGVLDVTPWTALVDRIALIVQENPPSSTEFHYGPLTVGPDGTFVPGHAFRLPDGTGAFQIGPFDPAGGSDTPGAANGFVIEPLTVSIPEIQGTGEASPLVDQLVTTTGVVSGDFQGNDQLRGFFLQDPVGDGDPLSSDGIFVFNPSGPDVNMGDVVEVTGTVREFFGMTEITSVSNVTNNGPGTALLPTPVTLPESVDGDLERYEGMLIEIANPMIVSQNFFLGRYGQMTLASPDDFGNLDRLFQPTNQFAPLTSAAIALAADNARRLLVLDDGQDSSGLGDNPNPVPYIGFPPEVIRAGDTVTNLIGVLDFGRINSAPTPDTARDYRLHPTEAPIFTPDNPRPQTPEGVGGTLRVASFNVLNYFPTLDTSPNGCGPDGSQECRGANSPEEFTRQRNKMIEAMRRMDAHVIGLIELENPRTNGPELALEDLVAGLNAVTTAGRYALINTGTIGTDAIKVALIYQPAVVTPIGAPAVLTDTIDPRTIDTQNRPPLAQTFERNGRRADLQRFTVVVNHFKSKGSDCITPAPGTNEIVDPDVFDGQGNCNLTRVSIAQALVDWLASDPTGSGDADFLVIGDLNSYAQEDPIRTFTNVGYTNLVEQFVGSKAYSFTFDGLAGYLDHALASAPLLRQVTGAAEWHINTDEPAVIDYNIEFNPPGYYSADPFRASDHDPVLVGVNLLCGDLDDDGDVDGRDLLRFLKALRSNDQRADYDGDGKVTLRDYRTWHDCYRQFVFPAH